MRETTLDPATPDPGPAEILAVVQVHPFERILTTRSDSFRVRVEAELRRFLEQTRRELGARAPHAVMLSDELARVVEAGGKRLRPLFCYWGYRAGGGADGPEIARAAAAIEFLHTFAVIHDDVIDRSDLRRGEPTTHRVFTDRLAGSERLGSSVAVLAGDLAQALADRLLAESGFAAERILAAFEPFNRMRAEAVAGELLDLLASGDPGAGEALARKVAALKSGSYTVVGPLQVGAALASADPAVMDALTRYGRPLGEAFQLRDDVLSTFGDPLLTGKARDTDIREGKPTALVAKAWRVGSLQVRDLLASRLGSPDLSPEEVEEVRAAIRSTGALMETVELIGELAARAKGELDRAPVGTEEAAALRDLADLVALRDA